jgi:hypothetical protein
MATHGDEESFYAGAEGLARRSVTAMYGSQQINYKTAEHHSLWSFFDLTPTILGQFLTPS